MRSKEIRNLILESLPQQEVPERPSRSSGIVIGIIGGVIGFTATAGIAISYLTGVQHGAAVVLHRVTLPQQPAYRTPTSLDLPPPYRDPTEPIQNRL